ncbi:MAG TPA: hypothetical protein VFL83_17965 [Anaeromyxobacter sp.]|nr:hypothetical protein [Anaeromyxobacter sp.]
MASLLARTTLVAAAAALALACGSDRRASTVQDDGGGTPGGGNPGGGNPGGGPGGGAAPCDGKVTLRIRGVDPGPLTAFQLAISGASFSVDGAAAVPGVGARTVDLLLDHAWPLGTVSYPEGATAIVATVGLAVGHATTAIGDVTFGACIAPLRIPIDLSNVAADRCHAVIHLDLAASVVASAGAGAGGAAFLPNLTLFY